MTKIIHLKKGMTDFIKANLAGKGYRYSDQNFYHPIPMGRQILNLAFVKSKDAYKVVPSVSIRHDSLERLYHMFLDEPIDRMTATIGAGYGNLGTGQIMSLMLERPEDIRPAGKAMLAAFSKIEKSFFGKFTSLEKIFPVLVNDDETNAYCPIPYVRAEKALVAAFLLGKEEQIDDLIDKKIDYLTKIEDAQLGYFLEFAVRFRRYLKEKH